MVIETRKGEAGGQELDLFIYRAGIEVVPMGQEQVEVAPFSEPFWPNPPST